MLRENEPQTGQDDQGNVTAKPNAQRVDEDNLEEKDLKTHYLFGKGEMKSTTDPGMEGQGMGGQQFGENNLTPAGNDKGNPPRYAGEDNAYFRRTQPAEEHPEDSEFKAEGQQGEPGNGKGQPNIPGPNEVPDQQKVGEDEDKQNTPSPQTPYREGTADNDGKKPDDREHIET